MIPRFVSSTEFLPIWLIIYELILRSGGADAALQHARYGCAGATLHERFYVGGGFDIDKYEFIFHRNVLYIKHVFLFH